LYLLVAITRQMRALGASESSLLQKSQQLDAALNNMAQGLCMFDSRQRLVICNKRYLEMYRLEPDDVKSGRSARELLEARVRSGAAPAGQSFVADRVSMFDRGLNAATVEHLRDGRIMAITHERMANGGWLSVHQDITAQKRAEAELAHLARFDMLTSLANRTLFLEKLRDAVERVRASNETFSVLMLDLDHFKSVNDSLGHPVGDQLLKEVAERLRSLVGEGEVVARLGGDEFAIIQPGGFDQRTLVSALASSILESLTQSYRIDDRRIVIGVSIGVTLAPQDSTDADALMRNADLALYRAKADGRNCYRFFEPAMETEARERRDLEEDMRRAIARGEGFELHYQTVVDIERRDCCGAEALARWRHPKRGLLGPDQFIALAEEKHLIAPLGEWILRRACQDAVAWPSHLKLAVNLSPAQFGQGDLVATVSKVLAETGFAPARLELEITETLLVENSDKNLALLHELKALGLSIVLDDFGTGYSSMRYLQMFPFDKIKIDKSFIRNMTTNPDSAAIVGAMAGLGATLGIETTAEGVETDDQLLLLRQARCRQAQGYLLSRPVPLAELTFEQPTALRRDVRAA
jgi:diguanylate cyclase (GGDEF)-like protein